MLNTRLLFRTARNSSRGGFTLVELLVVIGIIAILAGVALGPITKGIAQAKHNSSMQIVRQLGTVCFSYSTDNTANGNAYPSDTTSEAIANDLLTAQYVNDPTMFLTAGTPGTSAYAGSTTTWALAKANVSWNFTALTATKTGGVTSAASDLIPLIYFANATAISYPLTAGAGANLVLSANCPFGTDGVAVFYKGNNALYMKAGTTTAGTVDNFISKNCNDTTTYVEVTP